MGYTDNKINYRLRYIHSLLRADIGSTSTHLRNKKKLVHSSSSLPSLTLKCKSSLLFVLEYFYLIS